MDKLTESRQTIKRIFENYQKIFMQGSSFNDDIEVVADETHDNYMLMCIGWRGTKRVCSLIVYVRLRNGKFWVEEDGLEYGIATDLLEAGVPNDDIVLAFHHPDIRPLTEFAVG